MHSPEPDKASEARDQREFDEAVQKKGKVVLEVLAGAAILGALLMSMVALLDSGRRSEVTATAGPVKASAAAPASSASSAAVEVVDLKIIGSYKLGPDHAKHDAFTKTEFAVKVGQPLRLRIDNTDDVPHSITAPAAGVNIVAQPGSHVYTLSVSKAGRYQWYCMMPCDSDANGWAMRNPGYMSGFITAS